MREREKGPRTTVATSACMGGLWVDQFHCMHYWKASSACVAQKASFKDGLASMSVCKCNVFMATYFCTLMLIH